LGTFPKNFWTNYCHYGILVIPPTSKISCILSFETLKSLMQF